MRRSGSNIRLITLGQLAACTDTPLPRVMYPTIRSPRIGLQHFALDTITTSGARTLVLSGDWPPVRSTRLTAETTAESGGFSLSCAGGTDFCSSVRGESLP